MATGRIGTTPVLQVRWSKAPSAGTTSLSGLDDNSVSLVYSVGYEAVYRNGVLLSRTNDYTATNGTTVTLIDATIAGDIIEIFATQTVPLTDTYSQTVSDGRFIKNTLTTTTGDIIYASAANTPARLAIGSTDQVLKVSGGIPAWGAAASGALTKITTTAFSGATSVSVNNCFTSTYRNYLIVLDDLNSGGNATDVYIQWQYSTNTVQATNYYSGAYFMNSNGSSGNYNRSNSTSITLGQFTNLGRGIVHINVCNVGNSSEDACWSGIANGANSNGVSIFGGSMDAAQTYTGFKISSSLTIVGNLTVYGLEK